MNAATDTNFVIGISAVGGGGKTTLVRRVAELLEDAVTLHFDDYDGSNVHPPSLPEWFEEGADYDVYETPVFTRHIRGLKQGDSVTSPADGSMVGPAHNIVVDAPLGRAHDDSGRNIDLMIFVDTPLDVAMARRLVRNITRDSGEGATDADVLAAVKEDLEPYEHGARRIYTHFVGRLKSTSDLVLDGSLGVDELARTVVARIEQEFATRGEQ